MTEPFYIVFSPRHGKIPTVDDIIAAVQKHGHVEIVALTDDREPPTSHAGAIMRIVADARTRLKFEGIDIVMTPTFPTPGAFIRVKDGKLEIAKNPSFSAAESFVKLNDNQVARSEFMLTVVTRSSLSSSEQIIRAITFAPEHKQAGISILSYFNHVLETRYPGVNVGVTIEQQDNKVILIINHPEGEKERFEQEIENYAYLWQGKIRPEEYFSSQKEVMLWRNKYELVSLELRQTERLLYSERRQNEARIESLEKQVNFLGTLIARSHTLISQSQSSNTELAAAIRALSKDATSTSKKSLSVFLEAFNRGITFQDKEEIMEALESIKKRDTPLFQQIYDLTMVGIYQGVIGNFVYDWLVPLSQKL